MPTINLITHETRHGTANWDAVAWSKLYEEVFKPCDVKLSDIRVTCSDEMPYPYSPPPADGTILMGAPAVTRVTHNTLSLHKIRGQFIKKRQGVSLQNFIATFNYQEAYDMRTWEDDSESESTDKDSRDQSSSNKDATDIQPINRRFWVRRDITKFLEILKDPASYTIQRPVMYLAPSPDKLIQISDYLSKITGHTIFLDIETRIVDCSMDCIGFAVDDNPVVVVPFFNLKNKAQYPERALSRFLPALARAMSRNRIVCHNSMFDLFVLVHKYHLPISKDLADTMLMHHRIYPETEKSLALCISLYTNYGYHKDMHSRPNSARQFDRLLEYNARDVHCTRAVYKKQLQIASKDPSLETSITQVNKSIYPYIMTSLTGIRVDADRLKETKAEISKRIAQFDRIKKILFSEILPNASSFNPGSSKQCIELVHDKLRLPVVKRSTKTKRPKLGSSELYQLMVKHNESFLFFLIKYRELKKLQQNHNFKPYKR